MENNIDHAAGLQVAAESAPDFNLSTSIIQIFLIFLT